MVEPIALGPTVPSSQAETRFTSPKPHAKIRARRISRDAVDDANGVETNKNKPQYT